MSRAGEKNHSAGFFSIESCKFFRISRKSLSTNQLNVQANDHIFLNPNPGDFKMNKAFSITLGVFALSIFSSLAAMGQNKIELENRAAQLAAEALKLRELTLVMEDTQAQLYAAQFYQPQNLLTNKQVRENLELDQNQVEKLAQIRTDYKQKIQNGMKDLRSGKVEHKKWRQYLKKIHKESEAARGAVLLPHQRKRLDQISMQMKMKNQGDLKTLLGDSLTQKLGIDDDQAKRLKKRSSEIAIELEQEIAKLKEKARQKLIQELKPHQRKMLDGLVGEKFEFKKSKLKRRR